MSVHDDQRRVPAQDRAKQRVERILDAAGKVFAEQGYDAATMDAIATLAETSIGSIYQFFPNKLAVFNALAARYHEKLRALFEQLVESTAFLDRPWPELLDAAIDTFAAFHESEPAFRAVWFSLHLTEQVVTEGEALNREFAKRMEDVLEARLHVPPKMRPIVATMLVEVFTAMLVLAARRPGAERTIMAETKVLLRRYLSPYEVPEKARRKSDRRRPAVRSRR